jgi:hypothetical protein
MQSVANVIVNRMAKRGTDATTECLRPWQFSSMTAKGDPQLSLGPDATNGPSWASWLTALSLVQEVANLNLPDITGGATLYFAPSDMAPSETQPYTLPDGTQTVLPKEWDASKVTFTTEIKGQLFFTEA